VRIKSVLLRLLIRLRDFLERGERWGNCTVFYATATDVKVAIPGRRPASQKYARVAIVRTGKQKERKRKMILVKKLDPVGAKEYALWRCGRCDKVVRLGFKVGRNRGECYQCEQRTRERESYVAVYAHKNLDIAIRECLSCGLGFESRGKWNRRCPECLDKSLYIESENNFKRVKNDAMMKLIGDCVASEEGLIRGILY